MIVEYNRPDSIDEALTLLNRKEPKTVALGGGNCLSKRGDLALAVVDLQNLSLNKISSSDDLWQVGCTTTLQQLLEKFSDNEDFITALKIDASRNLRQTATIAGFIQCADGRSAFLTYLLAVDPMMTWLPGGQVMQLGDWLPQRDDRQTYKLITQIGWSKKITVRFESIGRTPYDKPLLCCAVAKWPSGRLRVVVGGFGMLPLVALDGSQEDDIGLAIQNVCHEATDQWASAEYRQEVGMKLGNRLLNEMKNTIREGDR